MKIKALICGILVALLQGCAARHYNDYRLDIQLKNYNHFEAETILDSAYYSLQKLEKCEYFQKWHPDEYKKLIRIIKNEITVQNYEQPNTETSCGYVRHKWGSEFWMDGDKLFSMNSSCSATDHTFAHEILHLCGFSHGPDLNTVLWECGVPLPERFRKKSKRNFFD